MNDLNRLLINAGLKPIINEAQMSPTSENDIMVDNDIDPMKGYGPRDGLEGPFNFNGRIVYYDPMEGAYYDPTTDFYLDHDETAYFMG
jgi:hypothetical protein